jgi:hypothetical protein
MEEQLSNEQEEARLARLRDFQGTRLYQLYQRASKCPQ